ncbi:MAG TPA: TetR/AcrR family transcriptional regulator [Myxococcus sp.]|nr:TetR/AcrR family transcriptional regulator [Myxococcus sp.]
MERKRLETRRAPRSRRPPAAESEESRRPGRPRSEEAHGAILSAAISLIREVGYDALAIDAIAARAGVGKATVYRRWKTKETLVAEAIERIIRAIPIPDTGSTQGDLMVLMRGALGMYQEPQSAALLSGLVAAMARSPRIAEAARSGFLATRRDALRRVLERGVARGDLRDGLDLELAIDLLNGPLFYRLVVTGGRLDERVARNVVDVVLRGLAPTE